MPDAFVIVKEGAADKPVAEGIAETPRSSEVPGASGCPGLAEPGYLARRRASGRSRISLITNASRSASGVPRRARMRAKGAWVGDA